ncbi:hypothetical protein RZN22_08325 [Bacillaceae bacterium S4-13-58]
MKNKNKFEKNQKVKLNVTSEIVTISDWSYVQNMKRYSYRLKEYPQMFYFEEELTPVDKE